MRCFSTLTRSGITRRGGGITACEQLRTTSSSSATGHSFFDVSLLPSHLREEFDVDANLNGLRYLTQRTTETSPIVKVLPTWVHQVYWRCTSCSTKWSARPTERLDPQVTDCHGCPSCRKLHADSATRTPRPFTASSSSLVALYPALAAQWDSTRNAHGNNIVLLHLEDVKPTDQTRVWWLCSLCATPWQESVRSRVIRYEKGVKDLTTPAMRHHYVSLCAACERRGATGRVTASVMQQRPFSVQFLSDDPLLMEEVRLQPHQDPAAMPLRSETIVSWHCRNCAYDYQASIANRYLRHERCPQCTGRVRTPYNLMTIQRPDVLEEVSKTTSRTRLSYITIYDDTEIPFVCRQCYSPYKMTARARCAVPQGAVACPKCFLAYSQSASQAAAAGPSTPHSSRQRWRITQAARRLSISGRGANRLEVTRNELRKRDGQLLN